MMTKELAEKCEPWAIHFRWAIRSNFVHMSAGDFGKVAALYKEAFGVALTKSQMNCNTCRLRTLKELGTLYEEWLQQQAEAQMEKRIEEAETQEVKKKPGRKKKIDID